jgi:hypothetical protein
MHCYCGKTLLINRRDVTVYGHHHTAERCEPISEITIDDELPTTPYLPAQSSDSDDWTWDG